MNERESLDAAEPRAGEEPTCPLCGTRIAHPFEPGGTVLCHPDRGGCGVTVKPVPVVLVDTGYGLPAPGPSAPFLSQLVKRSGWESCCRPFAPARPSGRRLRHSERCPRYPEELLNAAELEGWRAELRARAEHPAQPTAPVEPIPLRGDDAYVEAHMDDDDDR